MLTDKEYRLLLKIHNRRIAKVEELWPWEMNTFRSLYEKGCVELAASEERKQQIQNGEVMLDENTGAKADAAEEHVKPELEPGPTRVFMPAFIRRSFRSLLLGFLLGALFNLLMKLRFVFL